MPTIGIPYLSRSVVRYLQIRLPAIYPQILTWMEPAFTPVLIMTGTRSWSISAVSFQQLCVLHNCLKYDRKEEATPPSWRTFPLPVRRTLCPWRLVLVGTLD